MKNRADKKPDNRKKMMRIFAIVVAILCTCVVFSACSAPKEEEIYDRVVELVEGSYNLNTVFYGAGMPVIRTESDYAKFTNLYYDVDFAGKYEIVNDSHEPYTIQRIKEQAEKIYSKDYLEKVIYPMAFTGYAVTGGTGEPQFLYARFIEDEKGIYQSTSDENRLVGTRIYDYSTMKVVSPSNKDACYVTMDSYLDTEPGNVLSVRLRLVRQEDGAWYLDSFTG